MLPLPPRESNPHLGEAMEPHPPIISVKRSIPVLKIDAQYCRFSLWLGRSQIQGWGIYAGERIPATRKVIEYTGERISRRETRRRCAGRYLFTLDSYWTLDGAVNGSGAEFINHSCEPNLATRIVKGHILYFSRREIQKGEELTVDYNFDWADEKIPCFCRAGKCRGVINVR